MANAHTATSQNVKSALSIAVPSPHLAVMVLKTFTLCVKYVGIIIKTLAGWLPGIRFTMQHRTLINILVAQLVFCANLGASKIVLWTCTFIPNKVEEHGRNISLEKFDLAGETLDIPTICTGGGSGNNRKLDRKKSGTINCKLFEI